MPCVPTMTELDLVFFDTTSIYFEGAGGETIGERGYSQSTLDTLWRQPSANPDDSYRGFHAGMVIRGIHHRVIPPGIDPNRVVKKGSSVGATLENG